MDFGKLEMLAARAVIEHRIPLREKEVKFLRKALGLSYERFAGAMELSAATVMKWERVQEERLRPVNEVAVRSFSAEKIGLQIEGAFSKLVGSRTPEVLIVRAS